MLVPFVAFHHAKGDYADTDGLHFGIAIHATANTASDTAEAGYADHRTDGTSAHFYADADSVTQALDTDRRAGHAGSAYGNANAIAFELTGLNTWTRQRWLDSICWDLLGQVIAYILLHDPDYRGFQVRRAGVAEMQTNPKIKALYGHDDMRRAWGGTDHTDPGPNFPWDRLILAINQALIGDHSMTTIDDLAAILGRLDGRIATLLYGMPTNPYGLGGMKNEPNQLFAPILEDLAGLKTAVEQLPAGTGGGLTVDQVRQAVRAELAAVAGRITVTITPASP